MRFHSAQGYGRRSVAWRGPAGLLVVSAFGALIGAGRVLALPSERPADESVYTLARVYNKGDVDRYKVKTEVNTDGTALPGVKKLIINMVLKEQTTDVKPDGSAVINDKFEQATADLGNGNEMDVTAFLPQMVQVRDKSGRIKDDKNGPGNIVGGNAAASNMVGKYSRQLIFFYADKPVKVGDSWELEDNDVGPSTSTRTKGKGTLVAIETLNGVQTAKIKVVADGTEETEDPTTHVRSKIGSHFEATSNMDLKTGKILLMTGKTTYNGGPLSENQIEWKLKTGDDKDGAAPTDRKDTGKGAARGA